MLVLAEITHHDHSIIACSRHIYMVLFFAHIPFVVNHAFQHNATGVIATLPAGQCTMSMKKTDKLKAALCKQQCFFRRSVKNSQKAPEDSFRASQFLT